MGQGPVPDPKTQPHKPQGGFTPGLGLLIWPPASPGTPNPQSNWLGKLFPMGCGYNRLRVWVVWAFFMGTGVEAMRFMRPMRTTGPGHHFLEGERVFLKVSEAPASAVTGWTKHKHSWENIP